MKFSIVAILSSLLRFCCPQVLPPPPPTPAWPIPQLGEPPRFEPFQFAP